MNEDIAMNRDELEHAILCLEKVIKFSFKYDLNVHSSVGGKYGELWVVNELWKYDPKIGSDRKNVKSVKKPLSCDVVLKKTEKKLEVKWAMLHYKDNGPVVRRSGKKPFWGWDFSEGKQFKEEKFDYCILLAAKKDEAGPEHIFVMECDEIKSKMGRKKRRTALSKKGFYIEFSEDKNFYGMRKWCQNGRSPLEELLFKHESKYRKRWEMLKEKGDLK
jgi:hypothetical protein